MTRTGRHVGYDPKRTLDQQRSAFYRFLAKCFCVQLIQQRLGGLKVRGIEALGEPSVCVGEHLACFVAPTLLLAKPCQTCRRSELPGFAQLVPRRSDRATEVFFRSPIL
jgi:hypothetical protein